VETGSRDKSAVPWLREEEARPFVDLSSLTPLVNVPPSTTAYSSTVPDPTISLDSSATSFSSPTQTRLRFEDVVDLQPSGPNESEVERLLQSVEGLCARVLAFLPCTSSVSISQVLRMSRRGSAHMVTTTRTTCKWMASCIASTTSARTW
jgi:hypothetical protein